MLSRRFPVKSMFMGVVGRPVPHRTFDGNIHLERVSKKRHIQKCTAYTNFSDDALINSEINCGKWRILISADLQITVYEMKHTLYENYDLDEAVVDRLEFRFKTKIGHNGNCKLVVTEDNEEMLHIYKIRKNNNLNILASHILLEDVDLKVRKNWVMKSKKILHMIANT